MLAPKQAYYQNLLSDVPNIRVFSEVENWEFLKEDILVVSFPYCIVIDDG